jgi:hypothetical protein
MGRLAAPESLALMRPGQRPLLPALCLLLWCPEPRVISCRQTLAQPSGTRSPYEVVLTCCDGMPLVSSPPQRWCSFQKDSESSEPWFVCHQYSFLQLELLTSQPGTLCMPITSALGRWGGRIMALRAAQFSVTLRVSDPAADTVLFCTLVGRCTRW